MEVVRFLIIAPLQNLYMHLPYVGWEGKFDSQICSAITGIPEKHWVFEGATECQEMIERSFVSKLIVLKSGLQLYIIFTTSADLIFLTRRQILSFFFARMQNDAVRA